MAITALERAGLKVDVLLARPADGWDAVKAHVHPEFANYSEDALKTAFGVLWAERPR